MEGLGLSFNGGTPELFDECIPDIALDYYKKIGLIGMITAEEVATKLSETKDLIAKIKAEGIDKAIQLDTSEIPCFESYMLSFLEHSVIVMEKILKLVTAER